jgi:poly(3-hydroxyalkanoate) synthetase
LRRAAHRARKQARYFSIDSYLADLNVAVDEIDAPVDLIGLCQGGWLALVYAARFPEKVRRLVLAGAPIDIRAGHSQLSRMAEMLRRPPSKRLLVAAEAGVLGRDVLALWAPALAADDVPRILQVPVDIDRDRLRELETRFAAWYAWTLDMPGAYFLQVARRLFKENQIAEGRFIALGHPVDLARVRAPMFLLAARDDEIVSPSQLLVSSGLGIGRPPAGAPPSRCRWRGQSWTRPSRCSNTSDTEPRQSILRAQLPCGHGRKQVRDRFGR